MHTCQQNKIRYKANAEELKQAIHERDYFNSLIEQCILGAEAKQLAFNMACAYLDTQQVQQFLSEGIDINKMLAYGYNPIIEAATSWLLHVYQPPGYEQLAHLFARDEIRYSASTDATQAETELLGLMRSTDEKNDFLTKPKNLRKEIALLYWRRRNVLGTPAQTCKTNLKPS